MLMMALLLTLFAMAFALYATDIRFDSCAATLLMLLCALPICHAGHITFSEYLLMPPLLMPDAASSITCRCYADTAIRDRRRHHRDIAICTLFSSPCCCYYAAFDYLPPCRFFFSLLSPLCALLMRFLLRHAAAFMPILLPFFLAACLLRRCFATPLRRCCHADALPRYSPHATYIMPFAD